MAEIRATNYNWFDPTGEMPDEWDSYDATWLDRNYGGAPDECSYHYIHAGEIVKFNDKGECPKQHEHSQIGPQY